MKQPGTMESKSTAARLFMMIKAAPCSTDIVSFLDHKALSQGAISRSVIYLTGKTNTK